ncbi:hypothetical protein [Rappaport israeli]|uniref:hypothetical protein n=1 Tax=Rappaport israeli TaxID=1839807 RepID=UPI000AC915EE|nr:hypothetical protein [Rappaport israeli]
MWVCCLLLEAVMVNFDELAVMAEVEEIWRVWWALRRSLEWIMRIWWAGLSSFCRRWGVVCTFG